MMDGSRFRNKCISVLGFAFVYTCYFTNAQGNDDDTISLKTNSSTILTINPSSTTNFRRVVLTWPREKQFTYVILQLHTQYKSVLMSFTQTYRYDQSYNSSDPSILYMLKPGDSPLLRGYVGSRCEKAAISLLLSTAVEGEVPIPGGCCITCAMEIDPNIELAYVHGRASLSFHRAAPYSVGTPHCDDTETPETYSLKYRVYYLYIDDFTTQSLFLAVNKMTTPSLVEKHGTFLQEITGRRKLKLSFQPIKGQGVVFNVIVYDEKKQTSATYTPVSTYHCHFTGANADCYIKKDITSVTYCILCALIGVVICFTGYKLMLLLVFVAGWLFFWVMTYVTIYLCFVGKRTDLARCDGTERDVMIISSVCAVPGGALVVFFNAFQRTKFISFIIISVVIAMFLTSVVFYTPVGHLPFWDGDDKFIFAFCCFSTCLAVFFFFVPKFLCIFTSSTLGSYAVVLVPNYFFGGSLQYIALIAPLRMRSALDFFLERPYHVTDYVLCGVWVVLFAGGMITQYYTNRTKNLDLSDISPFRRSLPRQRGGMTAYVIDERTPLVSSFGGPSYHINSGSENGNAPPPLQVPVEPPPPYSPRAGDNEQSLEYN